MQLIEWNSSPRSSKYIYRNSKMLNHHLVKCQLTSLKLSIVCDCLPVSQNTVNTIVVSRSVTNISKRWIWFNDINFNYNYSRVGWAKCETWCWWQSSREDECHARPNEDKGKEQAWNIWFGQVSIVKHDCVHCPWNWLMQSKIRSANTITHNMN